MTEIAVGALIDLPEDAGTCVDAGGVAVAVFRSGPDVFAIANRCSHAEASLCEGDGFDGEVEWGASFLIDSRNAGEDKLRSKTFVFVYDLDGELLQRIEFHTSCSQPLNLGDQFASLTLVGFTAPI